MSVVYLVPPRSNALDKIDSFLELYSFLEVLALMSPCVGVFFLFLFFFFFFNCYFFINFTLGGFYLKTKKKSKMFSFHCSTKNMDNKSIK